MWTTKLIVVVVLAFFSVSGVQISRQVFGRMSLTRRTRTGTLLRRRTQYVSLLWILQADAVARTDAYAHGGYQRGQAGSSNGNAAERTRAQEVENNVYLRARIEDVRLIAREVEREDRGYRKLSKRDQNVIALNDAVRAGNYDRADEIQLRMNRDTDRSRDKTSSTRGEQAALSFGN